MSAGCVRWFLSHAARSVCSSSRVGYWIPASRTTICSERRIIPAASVRPFPFSTEVEDTEQTPAPKKKTRNAQASASVSSVGRKIPHRELQVISESGENMGVMHRADVIRIMDERGVKLVLLSERKDPPVYRLMSGKQIHEEQLKLREKNKAKAAPVQVKELTFSAGIASHDRITKLKQVESWLEKKHHVRVTLRAGRGGAAVNLDEALEQMVEEMDVMVGFISKPKVIREGQAAMCILRPPSAKELLQKERSKAAEESQSASSTSEANQSSIETVEGSAQQ
ncbi:translation initiation factor IF-3, mitochondrial [Cololabis saira]|uniref:translation initiation factor IF-3, mitochondrial n=1 Tax=Cololabis saira TaxID=129043 RepID=UPI002AD1D95D|nr:translation initiation factor IF-3, mitochondrial [Cololabis saira]